MKRYRDNKIYKTKRGWQWLMLIALMLIGAQVAEAQVRVPFTQRTSQYSPERKIYNIKGDFQMIGNTNLTLENYSVNGGNENNMIYVDIDGDPQTLNSSSATLTFSTENGAVPNCSNIIYAGLYWTGRAHNGGNSPIEFTISGSTNNRVNGNSFNGYTLSITSAADNSSYTSGNDRRVATYTFTPQNGGDVVIFRFYSYSTGSTFKTWYGSVTVQVGSGSQTNVTGNFSGPGLFNNYLTFNFTNAYTINTGVVSISINSLRKHQSNTNVNNDFQSTVSTGDKTLNKRIVKLKHAGASSYTTITAGASDIYYPVTNDGQMYSAYAEVTDYVKQHGLGEYFVADMALREGNGGGTGYYGGWGMIVVYENSKMKWRDITIFDGHAYVAGSTTVNYELPISGFNTAQSGNVEMKLGIIAGEGDVGISGDYFEIQKLNSNNWERLSHAGNTTGNFFNGSIPSTAPRNPSLQNNTGLDVAMFNINNTNNSIIANNQTSTKFRYGSTQDTYIISTIAMAVDAYVPDVEANNAGIVSINGSGVTPGFNNTVYPGDEIEFLVEVRNLGTEPVNNLKLDIPIPFTGSYMPGSAVVEYFYTPNNGQAPTHSGNPGTLSWTIGSLPKPDNSSTLLATIKYKIKVTENCAILSNTACANFTLGGLISGVGATSGTTFSNRRFISGYQMSGQCQGEPNLAPLLFEIDAVDFLSNNCSQNSNDYNILIEYCAIDVIPMDGPDGVKSYFPIGTRFFSGIETYTDDDDENSPTYVRAAVGATEYTTASPFPLNEDQGWKTYYAIPPGYNVTCYWEFKIKVDKYCGNFWLGSISNDWNIVGNWTMNIPNNGDDIEFATTQNNKGNAAVRDLHINGDRIIKDLINNSDKNLVVTVGNQLIINGTVKDNNPTYGTIIVESLPSQPTGTLLFTTVTGNTNVDATVQFYNKAYTCTDCGTPDRQQWQYFGIPVKTALNMPYPSGVTGTVNKWDESAFGNKWVGPVTSLSAFAGYEINDNANALPTAIYNFSGKLNVGNATVPLTYTSSVNYKGWNLIGNSYTGAIPISADAISYTTGGWNSTVYLFNTGSRHSWRKLSGNTVWGLESGRYVSVPLNTAGQGGLPDRIPSMHAFMIQATSGGNLNLDYSKLVKNTLVDGVAWRSSASQPTKLPYIVIDVIGTQSADRVWLFENMTTTRGFDAGWDGEKIAESGLMQLYVAANDDLKLQVATVPQLHDTYLGIKTDNNENINISFSVSGDVESRGLHMRDMLTGRTYPIRNSVEYTLPGMVGENLNRFKVVAIAGGDESKHLMADNSPVEVFVLDNQIGVSNKSEESCIATVYDSAGKVVAKQAIDQSATRYINNTVRIPVSVYVVKVTGDKVNETKRVMIK